MTLSVDDLAAATWRFSVNGQTATARLRLLPGGRIAGHRHPNEFYWRLDAARLILMNAARGVTSELELVSAPGEPLRFSGPYSGDPAIRFELTSHDPGPWPEFEPTRVLLAQQVADYGWSIGAHTYGAPGVAEGGLAKFTIGRFCSVAVGVVIALGDHKIANVTSYPFRGLKPLWPSTPHDAVDHTTRGDVTIGNDVWIGVNAFIGSGVTIGDGAVIGAGSVVTRDVPPYAIALGAPARVVRLRFTQPVIESLLAIAWWDWPEDWIDAVAPLLVSENIDGFIRIAKAGPGNLEALVLLVDEALAVPPTPMAAIRAKGRGLLDRLRGRPN